ncbi:uncharacterized protein LOC113505321 [Trichoplusia ni]|uniref:Uncharacterized protein LOC113505321 n=1 Tax=Trichoplusia ni TaxID=7111 RepID=A0A7E5WSG8_TRINI|nr:uncharacterized protein LOC113505321 [Trichoplusia ni]
MFITSSTNASDIYFDPIGSLKMIDGFLSVLIPIHISFIQPHIKNLNGVIGTSKFLCKQTALYTDIECLNLHQPLSIRYNDIIRDYDSISHLIESRSKRSAWFGGIGTLFKNLFGTMNEDDAINYSNAIQLIEKDQSKLSELVKQNILVTTSTLSSIEDSVNKISVNEQRLNDAIDDIALFQKNLTLLADKLILKTKFNGMLNLLESSLLTLSFKLEDTVNAIMFSKLNILYPSIISPKQLFTELVNNYRFLADNHQFPLSLTLENIHTLMNVSEIASYYNNNKVVFALKIPLVNSRSYDLYHNIPYPVSVTHDTYTMIIPSTKYLAINRDRSYYSKLDNLSSCKTINSQYYICDNLDTYSCARTPICESDIISKALKSVPSNCKTQFIQGQLDIWQTLSNNTWLYVITNPSKLSIDCKASNTEVIISGTGMINLPPYCIAFYKDSRLIPKYYKTIKVQTIKINFNLVNDSCCNSETLSKLKPQIPVLNLTNINLDSITSRRNLETSRIVNNLDKLIEKPHIVLYGEYYSYVTIIISVIIVIYIFVLFCKFIKSGICHRLLNRQAFKCNTEKAEELTEVAASSSDISAPKIRKSLA